ncbi:MAG: hypothetical protein JW795_18990 [Chitinivibrionales bacterium]|nr:hypothetical protein [Chitinivibrionales bacterium]
MEKWFVDRKIFLLVFSLLFFSSVSKPYDGENTPKNTKKEIVSLTELEIFYRTHADTYERRYILKAIPRYLTEFGTKDVPRWVIAALDSALDSHDGILSVYAVECIGGLKIDSFAEKLAEKFALSPQKIAQHSIWFRLTVLQTLRRFDSTKVKKVLPLLLKSYSEDFVLDPDFSMLMELTMNFGDTTFVIELNRFEKRVKKNIEALEKEMNEALKNAKGYDQFIATEQKITKTKQIISVVGRYNE